MDKKFKVFGVGLQKSGTSTLRECLGLLGYDIARLHKRVFFDARAGRMEAVLPHLDAHEAFTGLAPPYLYEVGLERYGKAMRAVLTTRRSPEKWLNSLISHFERRSVFGNKLNLDVYGYLYPVGREEEFIAYYEAHNQRVRDFFARQGASDQFLEICWETGDGWKELCDFLEEPVMEGGVPHSNRTADLGNKPIRIAANRMLMKGYAALVR
ncbi:hypothetical protein GGD81_000215 [Rhodobium orientis]|uniref:Sulfotransferase family protein n=1 Tax=Rhodobium orientis TaxID=34017 RepID=A0A327JYI1_9HYPH|nr:sulfotransferase [Rhodobium orientis]MBB4301200.1 hypothetical protein [Rhodobium orientis]MBK5951208.1 hypothetical protein [Rhodobium orientis]RAI30032.1 hypothetical protein CH339_00415 [Rhodobium orientis]